jgi:hypothetical protein
MGKTDICILIFTIHHKKKISMTNRVNTIKLDTVVDYNHHMGYVDKRERMATIYSISIRHGKWMKQLFSHLLDLAILNSHFLLS